MRKTLLVIAMLFTTAQVFGQAVTLTVVDEGDGWAAIKYSADANVSAFGLKVTADSGALFTAISDYNVGESTAGNLGYGIFPGTIVIDGTGTVTDDGTPVAPNDAPGAEGSGLGTTTLILEMGALYVEGNEPGLTGTLIKVQVDNSCNVCVEGEPIRGNIVFTDGTAVEANDCEYILVGCIVPDVLDMDETEAGDAIVGAGLVVGDTTYQCDEVEAAGEVLSQEPAGSTNVDCGTDVNLVVSLGPAVVPDVVGMTQANAEAAIDACDFISLGNVTCNWDLTATVGTILGQDPGPGVVPCGTVVDLLVVSSNTEPCNPMPTDPNYANQYSEAGTYISNGWEPNGCSPGGWGKPYQCIGDAAANTEVALKNYRVYNTDLVLLVHNWSKKMGVWPTGCDPAADVDHKKEVALKNYRCYNNDLARFICYWGRKDSAINTAHGGSPPCPMTDAQNDAWVCPW
jgi:hypothetical protein